MINEILNEAKIGMDATVAAIIRELARIRTGRAHPDFLDGVRVDYFGSETALKSLASVSAPEARQLLVRPWDSASLAAIERALMEANLGMNPNSDGEVIRLNIPALTEERRREFVKVAQGTIENGKVSIRSKRRDANEMVKELKNEGEISEDEMKSALEKVQQLTNDFTSKLDELLKVKEQEILAV